MKIVRVIAFFILLLALASMIVACGSSPVPTPSSTPRSEVSKAEWVNFCGNVQGVGAQAEAGDLYIKLAEEQGGLTAVLAYFLSNGQWYAFITSNSGLHVIDLEVSMTSLTRTEMDFQNYDPTTEAFYPDGGDDSTAYIRDSSLFLNQAKVTQQGTAFEQYNVFNCT